MPTPHPLIGVHEDRITRLEEDVTECRVELGVLKSQLASGIDMLSQKLDDVGEVKTRVDALLQHHDVDAEVRSQTRERRVRFFKIGGVVVTATAAVAGLVLKIILGE